VDIIQQMFRIIHPLAKKEASGHCVRIDRPNSSTSQKYSETGCIIVNLFPPVLASSTCAIAQSNGSTPNNLVLDLLQDSGLLAAPAKVG
jgi:hypothetical protein